MPRLLPLLAAELCVYFCLLPLHVCCEMSQILKLGRPQINVLLFEEN